MAAAAVLTGARSITAIAEWAAATPQPIRAALGHLLAATDHTTCAVLAQCRVDGAPGEVPGFHGISLG